MKGIREVGTYPSTVTVFRRVHTENNRNETKFITQIQFPFHYDLIPHIWTHPVFSSLLGHHVVVIARLVFVTVIGISDQRALEAV